MRTVLAALVLLFMAVLVNAQTQPNCSGGGTKNFVLPWTPAQLNTCLQQVNTDGTTIVIPAGTTTFTGNSQPVNVNITNSVTIQGAGAISSTDRGQGTTGTNQTIFISHMGNNAAMMVLGTATGKSLRITGIAF